MGQASNSPGGVPQGHPARGPRAPALEASRLGAASRGRWGLEGFGPPAGRGEAAAQAHAREALRAQENLVHSSPFTLHPRPRARPERGRASRRCRPLTQRRRSAEPREPGSRARR